MLIILRGEEEEEEEEDELSPDDSVWLELSLVPGEEELVELEPELVLVLLLEEED
jgi:hypothetical protein